RPGLGLAGLGLAGPSGLARPAALGLAELAGPGPSELAGPGLARPSELAGAGPSGLAEPAGPGLARPAELGPAAPAGLALAAPAGPAGAYARQDPSSPARSCEAVRAWAELDLPGGPAPPFRSGPGPYRGLRPGLRPRASGRSGWPAPGRRSRVSPHRA